MLSISFIRAIVIIAALALAGEFAAQAQTRSPAVGAFAPDTATGGVRGSEALLDVPSPELVDAALATLTDQEVRALLRDEMQRQAAERAALAAEATAAGLGVARHLDAMLADAGRRIAGWRAQPRPQDRPGAAVIARFDRGGGDAGAVALSFVAVVVAGLLSAWGAGRVVADWRGDPMTEAGESYWSQLFRVCLATATELVAVATFAVATIFVARLLHETLAPLTAYVWQYQESIVGGWALIVLLRRAFSPETTSLRIASVSDADARGVVTLGRWVVVTAGGGWLIAGFASAVGLGEAPAMAIVATTLVLVTLMLATAIVRRRRSLETAVLRILVVSEADAASSWRRSVALTAPFFVLIYVAVGGFYVLLYWLAHRDLPLLGPASTGLVILALPLVDRLGVEMAGSLMRRATPRALRLRRAIVQVYRLIAAGVAITAITRLWGFNLFDFAHAPDAPEWRAAALNVVWAVVFAWSAWQFVRAALWSEARAPAGGDEDEESSAGESSRMDTLAPLLRVALGIVAVVTVAMYALAQADVNIGPLLASAGIIGIALGFGAQALVRDVLSGVFFLMDDAFRVGEYIEIDNDLRGEVEAISLRSLQLRHHLGAVLTIPFGELKSVANHNRDWVICKMNFRLEPDTDPKQVKKLVKAVGLDFLSHPEHGHKFIEPLKSQGVYMIDDDSALVFRVKFKCKPRQQFVLRREIYHRLREVFSANGVILARRKVEVVSTGSDATALPDELLEDRSPEPAA